MPRNGRKKPNGKDGLGRALQRRKQNDHASATAAAQAAASGGGGKRRPPPDAPLQSILDANDFDEMMENVGRRDGHTVGSHQVLAPPTVVCTGRIVAPAARERAAGRAKEFDRTLLRIPRRPKWEGLGRDEVEKGEMDAFLTWRRATAKVEEDLAEECGYGGGLLTPFEKNLDVWRQLWRVVERSDVVVQIVDARNPLLYYCPDLYRYAADEMGRTHLLLVNKADLLSPEMITKWEKYFAGQGLTAFFFSAFKASVEEETHDPRVLGAEELVIKLHAFEHTTPVTKPDQRLIVGFIGYPNVGKSSTINVLLEMLAEAEAEALEAEAEEDGNSMENNGASSANRGLPDDFSMGGTLTPAPVKPLNPLASIAVGTIASTMNGFSSMAIKRVGVSSTPGKTKHFQTLVLSDRLMLCDCPGLVFPNFSASKSELICAGVLSIDTMRGNVLEPIELIARRIPASLFEGVYGIRFPIDNGPGLLEEESTTKKGHVSAVTLLEIHARARGFMTDHDRADHSRSSRLLLKQYVSGRILFAHAPPPGGPDDGEAGAGPEVHAKKGKLMHAREEAAAEILNQPHPVSGAAGPSAPLSAKLASGAGTGRRVQTESRTAEPVARVSGPKNRGNREFKRVERSYYPNPHDGSRN